jgi:arginase family enzyme
VADQAAADLRPEPAALPLERPFGLGRAYVHVDLDVLDPRQAPAVGFPSEDGLTADDVRDCVTATHALLPLCALSVSAFDPDRPDPEERTIRSATRLIISLVDAAGTPPTATPEERP